ncbi:SPL family radical SAM protein [Picrophilus oshimae]|uniref:Radical SAM family protein n=1 Tax=Picrophilus torridus (strain ATCC 700027 / DSM 9790 / JCM 10055 / NBRC 100828 / KAW 2/3) TaxID=1122961 RepID=Q6KYW7_PICTO|nr:radical SAM protein [Picrophilus oshimae]AAT44085.1 radical SAM family protein [Picrophilus oshimae DSM 9789]
MKIIEINARSAIGKSKMKELDYTFNPYIGCSHGCLYCYAMDFSPNEVNSDWGNVVFVRKNIIELLKNEVKGLKIGRVGVSSITDPYMPVEAKYMITRSAIEILARNNFYVTIQTKSKLITRDIDLFSRYKNHIDAGLTITTLKNDVSRMIEPGAPRPDARVSALVDLSKRIKTWIYIGPIIENINDDLNDIENIIRIASETGSRVIYDHFEEYNYNVNYMLNIKYKRFNIEWWREISRAIEKLAYKYNINANSEEDEWLYESMNQRRLF